MARVRRFTVTSEDDGVRIDAFVARHEPEVSRRVGKMLAQQGALRCNARRVPASHRVREGDAVELHLADTVTIDRSSAALLHEDQEFLYLCKPAGVHTVRLSPNDPETLADVARTIDPACASASDDPRESGALHRLDRDTSGIVVFARSRDAWCRGRSALPHAWKLYAARPEEPPPQWPPQPDPHLATIPPPARWPTIRPPALPGVRVRWPLASVGPRGARVRVDPFGQPAVSNVWPTDPSLQMFGVQLESGRRHQIRVHMKNLGLPLRGDPLYGNTPSDATLCLHAWAFQLDPEAPVIIADLPPWSPR